MTIWKYQIPIVESFRLELPEGATILSVQTQREEACLWALCDENARGIFRTFELRGTGKAAKGLQDARLIGTFQMDGGAGVFHLFETT